MSTSKSQTLRSCQQVQKVKSSICSGKSEVLTFPITLSSSPLPGFISVSPLETPGSSRCFNMWCWKRLQLIKPRMLLDPFCLIDTFQLLIKIMHLTCHLLFSFPSVILHRERRVIGNTTINIKMDLSFAFQRCSVEMSSLKICIVQLAAYALMFWYKRWINQSMIIHH